MKKHTQCKLRKGNTVQVSWIPTEFAVEGAYVALKPRGESVADDGWLVEAVWTTMASDDVTERSRDFKSQREASDRPRDGGRQKLKL